jgi:hypothetical protein
MAGRREKFVGSRNWRIEEEKNEEECQGKEENDKCQVTKNDYL